LDYTVSQLRIHTRVYKRAFDQFFRTVSKQCPPEFPLYEIWEHFNLTV